MPGEFEPHTGCWMAWPVRPDTWRDGARPAQAAFAAVARAIAQSEPVTVAAPPGHVESASAQLGPEIKVVEIPSDDAWMRDIGPTFVVDGHRRRGVDWEFNAWGGHNGGLYPSWDADDAMAGARLRARRCRSLPRAVRARGRLDPLRRRGHAPHHRGVPAQPEPQPAAQQAEIENHLRAFTGAEQIVWLGLGVVNDETDGHVDNLCCFIRPGVVALTWTDDKNDPQYERSLDARRRLEVATDRERPVDRGAPAPPARPTPRPTGGS